MLVLVDALKVTLPPMQIVVLECVTFATGVFPFVTTATVCPVHPFAAVAVTVYVVVIVGVAITVEPVELLRDDEGVHAKVTPPVAVIELVVLGGQIKPGVATAEGVGEAMMFTVLDNESSTLHPPPRIYNLAV